MPLGQMRERRTQVKCWQISSKRESGDDMELREFPTLWRAMLWLIRNVKRYRITVIIRINE